MPLPHHIRPLSSATVVPASSTAISHALVVHKRLLFPALALLCVLDLLFCSFLLCSLVFRLFDLFAT
jgi:hypothetical protein